MSRFAHTTTNKLKPKKIGEEEIREKNEKKKKKREKVFGQKFCSSVLSMVSAPWWFLLTVVAMLGRMPSCSSFYLGGRFSAVVRRSSWCSSSLPSLLRAATPTSASSGGGSSSLQSQEGAAPAVKISKLLKSEAVGDSVSLNGWVRTVRKQKEVAFVEVNDGSCLSGCQVVVQAPAPDAPEREALWDATSKLTTGCSVRVGGKLEPSSGSKASQKFDFVCDSLEILGTCDNSYPMSKKRHTLEHLRKLAHLRPRTNTLAAVSRVRSRLAMDIHSFFDKKDFLLVHTPLITSSDCEGGGDMFKVTSLDLDSLSSSPSKDLDYEDDFFKKPAYLTVSGQLAAECYACAMGDVYTFGPTFRAENSQTSRHLAEFHMVEPEMAFKTASDAMENCEGLVRSVVTSALQQCKEDLEFFQKFYDKGLIKRLQKLSEKPFARITYRDAITLLQKEIAKDPSAWKFPELSFGTDLATEHERWLAEKKFQSAVFVYDYPKDIKAFYMKDNDDDGGETVKAFDLLVPGVGELAGGSQREERLDVLLSKMSKLGLEAEDYWWYLELRKFGTVPHSGYGLGFERLVAYITGIENIRDAIAFPRYPGSAEF